MTAGSDLVAAMNSRDKKDWETPEWLVRGVEKLWGITFTLDAAASDSNHKAPRWITAAQDTQETLWGVDETVWLNPPYGEFEIPEFISRAKWALRRGEAKLVCFLIPNATENVVWHNEIFDSASEICFIEGRISFIEDGVPNNKNTHGSALVFFAKERGPGKWSWIKRDDLREAGGGNIRPSRVKLG